MTTLDDFLAEAIPHRPTPPTPEPPTHHYWTPAEQDQHWQDLCKAVGTPGRPRPTT
jgi:hypothetical protein